MEYNQLILILNHVKTRKNLILKLTKITNKQNNRKIMRMKLKEMIKVHKIYPKKIEIN